MMTATKRRADSRFEYRQLDYLLGGWGNALRNGWDPGIGYKPNILARFQPRRDAPPPEVSDSELQRVHGAWVRLCEWNESAAVAIWLRFVDVTPLRIKLGKMNGHGYHWTERTYSDYLKQGRIALIGALLT